MEMTEVEFGRDKYHLIEEMNRWLRDNVGEGGWMPMLDARWKIEGAFGNHTYYFKDPKDATLFALKWK
jgi:hypothetical protein